MHLLNIPMKQKNFISIYFVFYFQLLFVCFVFGLAEVAVNRNDRNSSSSRN